MKTGDDNATTYHVIALHKRRNVHNVVFSEVTFGKNHAFYVRLAYKHVDRFGTGRFKNCSARCYDMVPVLVRKRNTGNKNFDYWLKNKL